MKGVQDNYTCNCQFTSKGRCLCGYGLLVGIVDNIDTGYLIRLIKNHNYYQFFLRATNNHKILLHYEILQNYTVDTLTLFS